MPFSLGMPFLGGMGSFPGSFGFGGSGYSGAGYGAGGFGSAMGPVGMPGQGFGQGFGQGYGSSFSGYPGYPGYPYNTRCCNNQGYIGNCCSQFGSCCYGYGGGGYGSSASGASPMFTGSAPGLSSMPQSVPGTSNLNTSQKK